MCSEVSSISSFNDQQVNKQSRKREEFETASNDEKAILTPNGDVQYDVHLPTKLTLQDEAAQRDIEGISLTFRKKVRGTGRTKDLIAREAPIGDA